MKSRVCLVLNPLKAGDAITNLTKSDREYSPSREIILSATAASNMFSSEDGLSTNCSMYLIKPSGNGYVALLLFNISRGDSFDILKYGIASLYCLLPLQVM